MQLRGFIIEYVDTHIDSEGIIYLGDLAYEPRPRYGYALYFKGIFVKNVPGYEVACEVLLTSLLNTKVLGLDVSQPANMLAGVLAAAYPEVSRQAAELLEPLQNSHV